MIALLLSLAAQLDAGVFEEPELRMVAVPTVAWIAEQGLVVVQHRKGVCPKTHVEACGPDGFDRDVHSLRAVSLAHGKERWRNTTHPLLHGELRDGARVVALVASDVSASSFALLDVATGRPRATCRVATAYAAHVRFRSRHVDATGAFFVQRMFVKNGGAPPPEVPPLLLRATREGCTVVTGDAAQPLTWPNEDERVHYGGDGVRGHIDVTIEGRTRRVVIDEQPPCRRFACKGIP